MALKCCRFCETPLPAGEPENRPADFCNEDHRQQYQERIQRETVERLRGAQSALGGGVLQAGPPPGLMPAPPLRGVRRDSPVATEVETATVISRGLAPEQGLGALSAASAAPPAAVSGLGTIEKTDNASLSNLLRQARERIANDPGTTTALAVRRKPKPKAKNGAPAAGSHEAGQAAEVAHAAEIVHAAESAPAPAPATAASTAAPPAAVPAMPGRDGSPAEAKVGGAGTATAAEAASAQAGPVEQAAPAAAKSPEAGARPVAVKRVEEEVMEPPAVEAPVLPKAKAAAGTVSSPVAKPSLPSGGARLVKPSSEFTIEITPPSLALPAAGVLERVPWYAKAALVLLVAGGGGYAWWSTQGMAAPAPVKRKMEEVKPLNMSPTEWTTVKGTGADAVRAERMLTLHKASMELTDYKVEFVGTVDHRALGWAVRVQDPGNYYAMKLRKNPTGTARLSLIRWRVRDGEAGPEMVLPLEMRLPSNEQYTVKVDVRGDQIVTTLQGKVIDRWTDSTLTKGGFAYLNQNNERGKIVTTTIGMMRVAR